jgi:thymidylate synthase
MLVEDIRNYFKEELAAERFTVDKTGAKTIEILGANFIADEPAIFGIPNQEYINAEIEWYKTQSTNIDTLGALYGKKPAAWAYSANAYGEINSNYGHLVFSKKYYDQFGHALDELLANPDSRRAQMIYNRPSIWVEFNENNKNDFICTNAQTFYVRDGQLHMVSQMRSNDSWAGYRNDYAWAKWLMEKMVAEYNLHANEKIMVGNLHWQVMNLHVYSRNFYLVDHYSKTGEYHISKPDYIEKYPDSKYI